MLHADAHAGQCRIAKALTSGQGTVFARFDRFKNKLRRGMFLKSSKARSHMNTKIGEGKFSYSFFEGGKIMHLSVMHRANK